MRSGPMAPNKQTRASYLLGNIESAKSENFFCRSPSALFPLCGADVRGHLWRRGTMAARVLSCSLRRDRHERGEVFRISRELRGNDFEIDIIMCGVCISRWRFGNANESRGRRQKTTVGDMRRQRAAVGYKRRRLATIARTAY